MRSSALSVFGASGCVSTCALRLVVGLLLPLQLAIEEVGQILRLAVAVAAAAAVLLLLDLALPDFRLRLEQRVQRRHLVRNRVGGLLRLQLLQRAGHRVDGVAHRIAGRRLLRGRLRPRRTAAKRLPGRCGGAGARRRPPARRAPFSSACASATFLMSAADRPAARPALQVPRRADDLLLRRDQPFELLAAGAGPIAWLCAREYSSLNGFTSRKKISLRASVDCFARGMSRARA